MTAIDYHFARISTSNPHRRLILVPRYYVFRDKECNGKELKADEIKINCTSLVNISLNLFSFLL